MFQNQRICRLNRSIINTFPSITVIINDETILGTYYFFKYHVKQSKKSFTKYAINTSSTTGNKSKFYCYFMKFIFSYFLFQMGR